MIIKKITIENFLCFYGINELELSDGLNIVLGENGEGKTKLFEAIEWLFSRTAEDLDSLVSEKALKERDEGEIFKVRVSIITEQFNEKKVVSKSFTVTKISENQVETSSLKIDGVVESRNGGRTPVDGQNLLDEIFPSEIRKYSMFKGESQLDIFKNTDALEILINNFSQAAKYFDKYSQKGKFLLSKAQKAVEDSTKKDNKQRSQYKILESEIQTLIRQKNQIQEQLNSAKIESNKLEKWIKEADKYVNNASELDTINKRIVKIKDKMEEADKRIRENYTEMLFDDNLILVNFETIQKEFARKIIELSKEKRRLQSEFDREKGKKEGEEKLREDLLKNAMPLPVTVPSKAVMEEMLDAELCKVCGRVAKKDSEAYKYMMNRLKKYLASQNIKTEEEEEEEELFETDYISKLVTLNSVHEDSLINLRSVKKNIKELFDFNEKRKEDIAQLEKVLEKEKENRDKILGDSNLKEDDLVDVLKNYNAWQDDLKDKNRLISREEAEESKIIAQLKTKKIDKDKIDLETAKNYLVKTREVLRDIEKIFNETKSQKFNEFIQRLQDKSNEFLGRINVDSFTGTIIFSQHKSQEKTIIDVELTENGRTFHRPNTSLLTSMYISILFAISELASEVNSDKFPLIFDAPTSSFGESKTSEFLNLIHEHGNQKILLLKDFLAKDESTNTLVIKKEFEDVKRDKAFWLRLERPFDKKVLSTINTEVISL
jgi:DNA sulfur modification protein DndD